MVMVMNERAEEQIIAARLRLIRDHVFFGSGAMQLRLKEDPTMPYLMATNGTEIRYNPDMVLAIKFQEVIGVIAHEVLHVFLLHHLRRGNREPKRWNYAADYVINLILEESKFELPAGALLDKKYAGMNAEEVYSLLPEDTGEGEGDGKGEGAAKFGHVDDAKGEGGQQLTEAEAKAEEAKVKGFVQNAASLARKAGQMTANLENMVEALCVPKANWRAILLDFAQALARNDYCWEHPDMRQLHQYGIITPSLRGLELGELVLINDASGSCFQDQEQFASELSSILEEFVCTIHVVHHDTEVKSVETYTSEDLPIVLHPCGFGGTDPTSAYAYVNEHFDPAAVVHTTDGEMSFDRVQVPNCPVLIACSRKTSVGSMPKWATVIDIT